jgi:SAM-dependent methyltransferase
VKLAGKVVRRLKRAWYGADYTPEKWGYEERLAYLEEVVEYLTWENSRQASLLRHLVAPVMADLPLARKTKQSFDYQWAAIPTGAAMLDSPEFRGRATSLVSEYTGLPAEWFQGKRVIDVGCGNGRFSWALCQLGARVLSLDQSTHGLHQTAAACKAFPHHSVLQVDLLEPLPLNDAADLVWSFGVLHHTGDTYGAFRNIVPLVRTGGYLYLMIYGEPREFVLDDFAEVNEYEQWRRRTMNLELRDKLEAVRQGMIAGEFRMIGEDFVNGYFDAISPPINDLHTFEEIEGWLLDAGFSRVTRTLPSRNIHVVAQRRPDA